jgi:hypothetical protein
MQANPQKGEVGFEVGGKSYVFKLGTYAQAILERRVKMPWPKFFSRPEDQWGVDDTLTVFWAGLSRRHDLTTEDVADLIDELGADRVREVLAEAFKLANPEAGKSGGDPQIQEAAGTGTAS